MKLLNVMVACAENRVMGIAGHLPWSIPEDVRIFHQRTAGQIVVLGRVCYEGWPRAGQEGRRPVVITRNRDLARENVRVAPSVAAALEFAETMPGEIFVTGGERVFAEVLALPRALRLYLTLIHAEISGDRHFPEWRQLAWRETARRESADENYRYTFYTLERPALSD